MAMANPKKPAAALKDGAVDAVVAADKLQEAALTWLNKPLLVV
jgi:3-hydroxyacyl-CoA dehydrogenase/enoyl-CoA hydratase/3-hydroxybutyryl-CoA epimerase/enoyl-CoA isomerase